LIACCAVLLARFALGGILGGFVPFIPFIAAVAIAAWYGGLRPGLLATALSAVCADYFFVPERYALAVDTPRAVVGLAVFTLVGGLISALCESLHRMCRRLENEREKLRVSVVDETRIHQSLVLNASREHSRAAQMEELAKALTDCDRRKSEFLITIAHELRNPLVPLRNLIHVLRAKAISSPDLQWVTDLLHGQLGLMTRLIDDLLEVARVGCGKFELHLQKLELAPLLRGALDAARPAIEAREHELTLNLPGEPVFLNADGVRLAQVFSNLLNNAVKYSEPGGRIGLSCECHDGAIEIRVKDSGIGIPADMLELIFEPFIQLEAARQRAPGGLGIGLALARRLVGLHGGTLTARSDGPGAGSEFCVRLPALAVCEAF
jgi:signal transduction histidine kinase